VEEADPFAHLFEEGEAAPAPAGAPPAAPPAAGPGAPPAESPAADATPVAADAVPAPAPPPEALPFVPSGTWPGTVLSAEDAEGLLSGALVGLWPEEPLRPLTERVLEGLSAAEKQALQLQDASLPFEAGPIRRAAGLRWQVASALATAPLPAADGTLPPVDPAAVRAILSGIDAVLADLKRMSEGAGPEALRAIENVRHLLVKEAIDLTEAVQRLVPEGTAEIAVAVAGPAAPQVPGTRVLSNVKGRNDVVRQTPWGLIVVLGLAMAAAGAYHAHRWVNRPVPPPSAIRGAPTGTVGVVQPGAKILVAPAGQKLDPREVEAFKNQEQAKGNEVREVLPGTFVVVPPSAPPAGGQPATPRGTAP
jgi:hypothetical protein